MKILFLTNLLPYPLDNGGKIKTYTTICSLANENNDIDLVCFTEQQEINIQNQNNVLELCRTVEQVYLKLTTAENKKYMMQLAARSLVSRYSFGLYKYCSKKMEETLEKLCSKEKYDCVYFDHLQMCVYEKMLKELLPDAKFILDEHNCEALIMSRNAKMSSNILKKIFLKIESEKLGVFESGMLKKMDTVIVLSEEDYKGLKQQCGKEFKHIIIPIGVKDHGRKRDRVSDNKMNILFLGTLTWEPNNQGLIWFLTYVMPILNRKNIQFTLYIVGKNPSREVRKLAEQYSNIVITGYVESVDKYYDLCDCMIVPLFIGSGQRVKLIEGFSKGMPAVSTFIGAEGLDARDNDNILFADTSDSFAESIIRLQDSKLRVSLGKSARKTYESNYSSSAIAQKLNSVINATVIDGEEYV